MTAKVYINQLKYTEARQAIGGYFIDTASPELQDPDLLFVFAKILLFEKDLDGSIDWGRRAVDLYQKRGDKLGELHAENNLGIAKQTMGNWNGAETHYRASERLARELDNERELGRALHNLGNVLDDQARVRESLNSHLEALKVFRRLGNDLGIASAATGASTRYLTLREFPDALAYKREAVFYFQKQQDVRGLAAALGGLADIYKAIGDQESQLKYYLIALVFYRHENYEAKMQDVLALIDQNIGSFDTEELKKVRESARMEVDEMVRVMGRDDIRTNVDELLGRS